MSVMNAEPRRSRFSKVVHFARDPLVLLGAGYVAVSGVLRANFVYSLDALDEYWRAGPAILAAGALHDAALVLVLAGLTGMPSSARVGVYLRRATVTVLALFTGLTSVNLSTFAALHIPAHWSMLGYLADPVTARDIHSPVDPKGTLFRLGLALAVFLGVAWFSSQQPHRPRTRRVAIQIVVAGFIMGFASQRLASLDHRAGQIATSDGASWLTYQLLGQSFEVHGTSTPREAILTPSAIGEDVFVSTEYPLARGPLHLVCDRDHRPACDEDKDGDGVVAGRDCNDHDRDIHPGAVDAPHDGIDQDCSGLDASPPDVLVLELEGLPARVLAATGGVGEDCVAPRMDELAKRADARLFTRFETAGTQTSRGFVSAMCSSIPHYGTMDTRSYPTLGVRCLPDILREKGYEARFVQNGSPKFDDQGEFAEHIGFERITGREDLGKALGEPPMLTDWGYADEYLFRYVFDLFEQRREGDKSLFVVAQTITNHHPYVVPPSFERFHGRDVWSRLRNTSGYVDWALGEFVKRVDDLTRRPGSRPMLVVMSGDHGHPSEMKRGNTGPTTSLYGENVHTPFLVWSPGHPERLARLAHFEWPASGLDVMPTILGLLGAKTLHASMGRDLGAPAREEDARAVSMNSFAGGMVRLRSSKYTTIARAWPPATMLFDAKDLRETHDLAVAESKLAQESSEVPIRAVMAAKDLIERDRIWSPLLLR